VLTYHLLDVFTREPYGGNPLAVFLDSGPLPTPAMQRIARELNLSETVFVEPPRDGGAARLRIFTPAMELPFAGHPTVGTAVLLAALGRVAPGELVLEEEVGPVTVTVTRDDDGGGKVADPAAQSSPSGRSSEATAAHTRGAPHRGFAATLTAARPVEIQPPPAAVASPAAIAALVGLEVADLARDVAPAAASTGVPFLCIPLGDAAALARAGLDLARWRADLAATWAPHLYLFAPGERPGTLFVRMFAPAMGIEEDPATGAAATALAGLLAARDPRPDGTLHWTLRQGLAIGRPSELRASATKVAGLVAATRVGGHAVVVGEGRLLAP
jgi:trans-2,3-dihydro-3-hydroxyanthranilate isomerase